MNTKELPLVTFEQAKRLKKLGFDWEIFEFYAENGNSNHWKNAKYDMPKNWNIMHDYKSYDIFYSAPTVALALKWMRDVKGIRCSLNQVLIFGKTSNRYSFSYNKTYGCEYCTQEFDTYESAESTLLDELLRILEKDV